MQRARGRRVVTPGTPPLVETKVMAPKPAPPRKPPQQADTK